MNQQRFTQDFTYNKVKASTESFFVVVVVELKNTVVFTRFNTKLVMSGRNLLLFGSAVDQSQILESWLVAADGSRAGRQLWWPQLYYSLYCRAVI